MKDFKDFKPNVKADIKYIMLDLLDEKDAISTTDVFECIKNQCENASFTRSELNDIIISLFFDEDIIQVKDEKSSEYVWTIANKLKEKEETKKEIKKVSKLKKQKENENSAVTSETSIPKNAKKHSVETDKGEITFFTVKPGKYNDADTKGYWVATSDECLDVFLFDKSLSKKIVVALVMQLVDTEDDSGITVKKNF